jgi:hypothetical protein
VVEIEIRKISASVIGMEETHRIWSRREERPLDKSHRVWRRAFVDTVMNFRFS